jgi:hypothetical protein
MNSKESIKDNPQDIAFRNNVVSRLSNLETDYVTRRNKQAEAAKASSILKKRLGKGATEISGLGSLQPMTSQLGKVTKLNTRKK